ncbi:hypothetical protein [Brevundimonas vesicularis]|uniref:hypothetical protein n=1 Tax=Brevundimonas vesicularis TaxID=41276 RepID=UPI0028A8ACEF|nr:hypothetical protein [Brevundimonas vesicularis]
MTPGGEGLDQLGFDRLEGAAIDVERCNRVFEVAAPYGLLQTVKFDAARQIPDRGHEGFGDFHAKLRRQLSEEPSLGRALCHVGLGLQLPGVVASLGHEIKIGLELGLGLLAMMQNDGLAFIFGDRHHHGFGAVEHGAERRVSEIHRLAVRSQARIIVVDAAGHGRDSRTGQHVSQPPIGRARLARLLE